MRTPIRNAAHAHALLAAARVDLAHALAAHGPHATTTRLAALRVADLVDATTK